MNTVILREVISYFAGHVMNRILYAYKRKSHSCLGKPTSFLTSCL